MPPTKNGESKRKMSADVVYEIASYAFLGSLVVGVIASYAMYQSGNIKETNLKRELAYAGADAAQANERAAELEKEAETARLETEKLKNAVAWRHIKPEQYTILLAYLKDHPIKTVWTAFDGDDAEAIQYRLEIDRALHAANSNTLFYSRISGAAGLLITDVPGDDFDHLTTALTRAEIPFSVCPPQSMMLNQLAIIVGTKPPPHN